MLLESNHFTLDTNAQFVRVWSLALKQNNVYGIMENVPFWDGGGDQTIDFIGKLQIS